MDNKRLRELAGLKITEEKEEGKKGHCCKDAEHPCCPCCEKCDSVKEVLKGDGSDEDKVSQMKKVMK